MRTRMQKRAPRALTSALLLALLAALLLAGSALAAGHDVRAAGAKPGKPTAKAPKGTITTATPSFTWSKAKGASKYELRVYQGKKVVLKKTGLKKTTWKAVKALPSGVALTWKVRASNARGSGAWSRTLTFKIVTGSSAKAITAFSFQGLAPPVTGVINEALHTIALTVPYGAGVAALVPTITITGASVSPASGVARDFTSPVTYTVTAADGTTQDYLVTVTIAAAPLAIGDAYGGGIVAYILQSGDPGYVAGQTHGLIAATADQTGVGANDGIQWAREPYWYIDVPGAKGIAIGTGAANTNAIIAQNGAGTDYAAGLARAYTGGGYSDWYLPSKDELNKLYLNRTAIGGFHTSYPAEYNWYWSSYQAVELASAAWGQPFDGGPQNFCYKSASLRVRAVRAF